VPAATAACIPSGYSFCTSSSRCSWRFSPHTVTRIIESLPPRVVVVLSLSPGGCGERRRRVEREDPEVRAGLCRVAKPGRRLCPGAGLACPREHPAQPRRALEVPLRPGPGGADAGI